MVKQISLDAWQIRHLVELLRKGSGVVSRTNAPIVLYRQTLEEEEGSYEEIVCTLGRSHIVEQRIVSGGVMPPTIHEQFVFSIDEYPSRLIRKSRDRFLQIVSLLEIQLK